MITNVDTADAPSGAPALSLVRPILHDFAYRTCAVCHSPIPAHQLVDDDYRPRHAACAPEWPLAA